MAVTDSTILTGVINICVNKYAESGPEYKSFYPKTETAQIVDFDDATKAIIDERLADYEYGDQGTIKTRNLTVKNNISVVNSTSTQSLKVHDKALIDGTLTATNIAATNSVVVKNGDSVVLQLNNNGEITATLKGNADTTTALKDVRSIDGVNFDGTYNINHFGISSTASTTQEKVVTFTDGIADKFVFTDGLIIAVRFTQENNADNPKLKIGTNTAMPMYYRSNVIPKKAIQADSTYAFVYNSGKFYLLGDLNEYYTNQLFAAGASGTSNETTDNDHTYLRLIEKDNLNKISQSSSVQIKGTDDVKVSSSNGTIIIDSSDANVEQNNTAKNNIYPILFKNGIGDTKITSTVLFNSSITINPSSSTLTVANLKGNAETAAALQTKRDISIQDASNTNTGVATGFDGSSNIKLKLPETIKADLDGTAEKAKKDNRNNEIDSTYIAEVTSSNSKLVIVKGDGTATYVDTSGLVAQDINVSQSHATGNANYPILFKQGIGSDPYTGGVLFNSSITINPSTGVITAAKFNGNATTAERLQSAKTICIQDSTASHTGLTSSFDGSSNIKLKLPETIRADLDGTAEKAKKDNRNNEIDSTYIKSISINDSIMTITRGNDSHTNITMPINTQQIDLSSISDEKVYQSQAVDNVNYPVLFKKGIGSDPYTGGVLFNSSITINPSTGVITAAKFNGAATTAEKLQSAKNIFIQDATASHSGETISFDGSADIKLKLPTTIKANLEGTANRATYDSSGHKFETHYATKAEIGTGTSIIDGSNTIALSKEITLSANSWTNNTDTTTNSTYPKQYVINDNDITANDIVKIIVKYNNQTAANDLRLSTVVLSSEHKIVLLTRGNPTSNIDIMYYIYSLTDVDIPSSEDPTLPGGGDDTTSGGGTDTTSGGSTDTTQGGGTDNPPTPVMTNEYIKKLHSNLITVKSTEWKDNTGNDYSSAGYNFVTSKEVSGVNSINDVVDVAVANIYKASGKFYNMLKDANIYPVVNLTSNNNKYYINLYAKQQPAADIPLSYHIYQGIDSEKLDESAYMPKVYSRSDTIKMEASKWTSSTTYGHYPYRYEIADTAVKANDIVEVIINPNSKSTAKEAGIMPITTSQTGKIYIYAKSIPNNDINIIWRLYHGAENDMTGDLTQYMFKKKINSFVLSVDNWNAITSNTGYNYKYTINSTGVITDDIVEVIIQGQYKDIATNAGMCPVVETEAGKISLYSVNKPVNDIIIEYYIYQGDPGSYTLIAYDLDTLVPDSTPDTPDTSDTTQGGGADTTQGGGADTTQGGGTDTTQGGSTDTTQGGGTDTTQGGGADTTQGGGTDTTQGGSTDTTQGGGTDNPPTPVMTNEYINRLDSKTITIAATDWNENAGNDYASAGYNFVTSKEVNGVNSINDVVDVAIADIYKASGKYHNMLRTASIYPVVNLTSNNNKYYINLYAKQQPVADIPLSYHVYQGIDSEKLDESAYMPKLYSRSITIDSTASKWTNSTTYGNYPYRYEIADTDIKVTDIVEIIINPNSKSIAKEANIMSIATVEEGKFYIYAESIPKSNISIIWRLYHGAANDMSDDLTQYMFKKKINSLTLSANNWTSLTTAYKGYNYKYTINSTGVIADDIVEVIIQGQYKDIATNAGMCPVVKTEAGTINLYSVNKPSDNIVIEYYIYQGKANSYSTLITYDLDTLVPDSTPDTPDTPDTTQGGGTDTTSGGGTDTTQSGSTDTTSGGGTDTTSGGGTDTTQGGSTDTTSGGSTDTTQGGAVEQILHQAAVQILQ